MKTIRATWVPISSNPFAHNTNQMFSKKVSVPESMDIKLLEQYAKEVTPPGFFFDSIEDITDDYYDTYHGGLC